MELGRFNYTTPTSFLDFTKLYIHLFKIHSNILPLQIRKYSVGLDTLRETNIEVERLKKTIIEFQPVLEEQQAQNKTLMSQLDVQNKRAMEKEVIRAECPEGSSSVLYLWV